MLNITQLSKQIGQHTLLNKINLQVNKGQVISILGSSGAGKSTLLRCISCLESAEGKLTLNQIDYTLNKISSKDKLKLRRSIGMVFQSYNLFNHKTALENIMLSLMLVKKLKKKEAQTVAEYYLAEVGLSHKASAYPTSLSGGQQQRIAIARTLAMSPDLILLDEPTSALDPELVNEVLFVIKKMAQQGITLLIVTHEMRFSYEISDSIVFMDQGEIIEQGTPETLFLKPKTERAKRFFAQSSLFFDYKI